MSLLSIVHLCNLQDNMTIYNQMVANGGPRYECSYTRYERYIIMALMKYVCIFRLILLCLLQTNSYIFLMVMCMSLRVYSDVLHIIALVSIVKMDGWMDSMYE